MIGRTVEFEVNSETIKGTVLDRYQGYKWVDSTSPTTGRMNSCISVDYYIVRTSEKKIFHVLCSDIKKVLLSAHEII
jgi:hypothetical protein